MSDTTLPIGLPAERLERTIPDLKPPLSHDAAIAEAHRCLYCYDAPCIQACPTDINIPEFIKRIATGNVRGAAKTILEANILGHSCARVCPVEVLCAGDCVYNDKEEPPIQIGRLQRYATEYAYDNDLHFFKKGPATGRKVALVGGGPASLAAAHELTRLGHECVVFEGRSLPGGLNTTGVAPYKYHAEDALAEVAYVSKIGFEVRTNTQVGVDVSFDQLTADYDAVFLGVGLGPDSVVSIPGEDLPGSVGAVHLIERIKNERGFSLAAIREAVVIGGGNTAIDIARELKKVGVPEVTMAYRRDEASMSGYKHELEYLKKEGVKLQFMAVPVAIEGNGQVSGLRCQTVALGAPDASGRQALVPVAGAEFVLPAQLVVKATGQEKLVAMLQGIEGLKLEKGRVSVDPRTHQTGHPKVFAGGDCVNGGKEVVNAAAEGKAAARGIDGYLRAQQGSQAYQVTIK